jgi:hypothetical protein
MNLRALAASDPDTPERQRNCGVVPVSSEVEIRIKDGSAYYCGLETCGNVWLCPVCSAKIHKRRSAELRTGLTAWQARHVTAGAAWQRLKGRLGIGGHIIALEFTLSDETAGTRTTTSS